MWHIKESAPDRYGLLKELARKNRKNMTEAESALWQIIRDNFLGTKVLRQYIIGDYIVDFLLPYYSLVIEVDGAYHAERTQQDDDLVRSENLNKWGFYVMRFTNEQVLFGTDEVIEKINYIINKMNPNGLTTGNQ